MLISRVLQLGEKLFIRMELVDVRDGWQVWGEEYSEEISDMHTFQAMIAKDVSEKLRLKLRSEEQQRLLGPHTNAEAYQFYLKGRSP